MLPLYDKVYVLGNSVFVNLGILLFKRSGSVLNQAAPRLRNGALRRRQMIPCYLVLEVDAFEVIIVMLLSVAAASVGAKYPPAAW